MRPTAAWHGCPRSDKNLAGAAMMVEQMFLTILLLGCVFYRFAIQDEQRQSLMDLAAQRGIPLTEERAARAAAAGAGEQLRERLLRASPQAETSEPERTSPESR